MRDEYETKSPSKQNIYDRLNFITIFPNIKTTPGTFNVIEDQRIIWTHNLINFENKKIMECGPFELGHSFLINKLGAKNITAVENNWHCYLKCLVVKDTLNLNNIDLLFGDVCEYLKNNKNLNFDIVLCSGILYHLTNPVELIYLISLVTDNIFIWTHIYDDKSSTIAIQNLKKEILTFDNEEYKGAVQTYKDDGISVIGSLYCGGKFKISFWIEKESLYKALKKYGFINILENNFLSDLNHVHGPAISLIASKNKI